MPVITLKQVLTWAALTYLLTLRHNNITHLFYLELKTKKGNLSPAQKKWNADFDINHKSRNCQRSVAYVFLDAKRAIADFYLAVAHQPSPNAC